MFSNTIQGDHLKGHGQINRREWRWVLLVSLLALALTSLPYLLGRVLQTESLIFGGFVYNVEDGYSYLAKMRQGAGGSWLFTIAYTAEPHPPRFFFAFHLLLGRLAALLPGGDLTACMAWTYHAARLLFGLGLLLTVYRFLAACTADLRVRRLAFLLVTFGGGLGWLLILLGRPEWLGSYPLDLILPEGFTFLVLYLMPHIALARTLLLWGLLFLLWAWEGAAPAARTAWAAAAGLMWLGMGVIVPFYVAVAWAVSGAMGMAWAIRRRALPWREASLAALAALLSAPIVLYSAWVFTHDPVMAAWAAQNLILSPHPLHYLAAFGLPLLLALLAARSAWREQGLSWAALAWVAVVPLLVYLPFNLQRRLVEGVQVPLSLLAARVVVVELPRWSRAFSRWAAPFLLMLLIPTNLLLIAGNCQVLLSRPAPIFRDAAEVAALDWLSGQVEAGDVVLSAYETGNYLPARVGARVFVGHGPETVRSDEKRALAARFFDAAADDAWRLDLLATYGIDWVFWGPAERALGSWEPAGAPYLQLLYQQGDYVILRVRP